MVSPARSFVNADVPDNAVAYGVPAKVVRKVHGSTGPVLGLSKGSP